MEVFLLKLAELSLQASAATIVILWIRFVFRRMPKKHLCVLWMIVAARLIIPFSLETEYAPSSYVMGQSTVEKLMLSLEGLSAGTSENEQGEGTSEDAGNGDNMPETGNVDGDEENGTADRAEGVGMSGPVQNAGQTDIVTEQNHSIYENKKDAVIGTLFAVWFIGLLTCGVYGTVSILRIKRLVRGAIPYQEDIWLCERVKSPFLFGVFRPQIYLPCDLEEEQIGYVLAHEKAHVRRGDHITKAMGYVLLSVYWFQPLLWVAYSVFCKDIEAACDEKVIVGYALAERKTYSETLLECSVEKGFSVAHPLAFGERNVAKRVKEILRYKKAGKLLTLVSVLLCVVITAGCFVIRKDVQSGEQGNLQGETVTPTPVDGSTVPRQQSSEILYAVPMGQRVEIDLDGDGSVEGLHMYIKGYEGNVTFRKLENSLGFAEYVEDIFYVYVDGLEFHGRYIVQLCGNEKLIFHSYYILDLDVSDKYKEFAIAFQGPSGDPSFEIFRYAEGELIHVGQTYCWMTEYDAGGFYEESRMSYTEMVENVDRSEFLISVSGDGMLYCVEREQFLETTEVVKAYQLVNAQEKNATLEEVVRSEYVFIDWKEDRGEYCVRAAREFVANAGENWHKSVYQPVTIPEGTRISFYKYYPEVPWETGCVVFAYGENLENFAYFLLEKDGMVGLPAEYVPVEELFLNLMNAG